ncbi:secreted protein [Melampsora americana]|nr:secreted protein [Melampsora americana]
MFLKVWFLILVGFIALIPLNQSQIPGRLDPTRPPQYASNVECSIQFSGNINSGICASNQGLYDCQGCPPGNEFLQNCVPLDKLKDAYKIPNKWKVPKPKSKGTTGSDIACPNFSRLVRNGKPFGYGCYNNVNTNMTHFCGQVAPYSK